VSGKPIKKKSEQVGQAAPAKVNASEAPVIAQAVTGHYQPIIQSSTPPQPATAASGLTEGSISLTVTDDATKAQLETVQLSLEQLTKSDIVGHVASEPLDGGVFLSSATDEALRDQILGLAGDEKPAFVETLLVQAVSPHGFWRVGRFWPHAGVQVVVDAALKVDIIAPYISVAIAKRLKEEPHLRVTVVDAITTEDPEA